VQIDLTEVERLAWEGLLREQGEAMALARELGEAVRRLGDLPRPAAILSGVVVDLRSDNVARAMTLSAAIAVAHGLTPPQASPRFTPAATNEASATLAWDEPQAPGTVPAEPAEAAPASPVATSSDAP
jgi:hypothetical protein